MRSGTWSRKLSAELIARDRIRARTPNEEFLSEIRHDVEAELRREGIPARVEGRVKRAYSVFQKLKRQKITLDQVYDLLAVRIITDSVKNCYAALGVIHNEWRPDSGPHQGFHRHSAAQPVPIAAHLRGGAGRAGTSRCRSAPKRCTASPKRASRRTGSIRKGERGRRPTISASPGCATWWSGSATCSDPGEFMSTLKVDLYPEEVYTFTPRGKVIVLPRDATPIDFAYAIHSDVGNTCVGAKVNGRIVPLRYALHNGDIVEILTQPGHEPSKDWLALVKTSRARNKIKHVINATERAKAIEIGAEVSGEGSAPAGRAAGAGSRKADLERVAGEYGYSKIEDLYAALGYGKFSARQVLQKLAPDAGAGARGGSAQADAARRRGAACPRARTPGDTATWSSR